MKCALYARVSTDDRTQDPENQLIPLREYCERSGIVIYREYVDHARAKDHIHRTAWQQLQKDARQHKFKVVLVFNLDRAFRSVRDCVNCIEDWQERNIGFKCLKQDVVDTTTSMGRFALHVLAAAAELESSLFGDRVAAGLARAKAQGKQIGRTMLNIPVIDIYDRLRLHGNISQAARELSCSRAYIHTELARYGTTPQDVIAGRWKLPSEALK